MKTFIIYCLLLFSYTYFGQVLTRTSPYFLTGGGEVRAHYD